MASGLRSVPGRSRDSGCRGRCRRRLATCRFADEDVHPAVAVVVGADNAPPLVRVDDTWLRPAISVDIRQSQAPPCCRISVRAAPSSSVSQQSPRFVVTWRTRRCSIRNEPKGPRRPHRCHRRDRVRESRRLRQAAEEPPPAQRTRGQPQGTQRERPRHSTHLASSSGPSASSRFYFYTRFRRRLVVFGRGHGRVRYPPLCHETCKPNRRGSTMVPQGLPVPSRGDHMCRAAWSRAFWT